MSRASMAAGSSFAICIRFSSSRQESPASTRMRVRLLDTSVLFPLEPEASTVILIMRKAYAPWLLILGWLHWRGATCGTPAGHSGKGDSVLVESSPRFASQPTGIHHANEQRARPVFGIPQAFDHHSHDVQANIEPDKVGQS